MKIYDCFMYMNEDKILDLRLNYLEKFVDHFVIVESNFYHNGQRKKLKFNIKNFLKFKSKIIYLILDKEPNDIEKINDTDSEEKKDNKQILNGMRRDFYQRNFIEVGLKNCSEDDIILVSDIDEIPKLDNFDKNLVNDSIIFFKQKMFYYKFNLCSKLIDWYGTRACKKKNLKNPQWLRNLKSKFYPIWRLDVIFSNNKVWNAKFINDGGWHFSYLNTPEEIENKLKNYAHHREYELSSLNLKMIKDLMNNKVSVYNLLTDMRNSKFGSGQKLETVDLVELPSYLRENYTKYKDWFD